MEKKQELTSKQEKMVHAAVADMLKKQNIAGGGRKAFWLAIMVLFGAPALFITLSLLWKGAKWVFSIQ